MEFSTVFTRSCRRSLYRVDPYYLTFKAQYEGFHPQMILAGRRTNDGMGKCCRTGYKAYDKEKIQVVDSNILMMGFTFKENCPDTRNTRVIDIYKELKNFHTNIDIWDPWADIEEAKEEYGLDILSDISDKKYNAVIVAVGHEQFKCLSKEKILDFLHKDNVIYDVKGVFPKEYSDGRL